MWTNSAVAQQMHTVKFAMTAGKLNSDFSDLAQQLHLRNSAIDGENLALEGYLPLWSNSRQQISSGLSQAASPSISSSQFPIPVSSFHTCLASLVFDDERCLKKLRNLHVQEISFSTICTQQ